MQTGRSNPSSKSTEVTECAREPADLLKSPVRSAPFCTVPGFDNWPRPSRKDISQFIGPGSRGYSEASPGESLVIFPFNE
ncbi:hypothetical protein RRG08_008622 [Elysia crispata]|uniref:Uncharacterized protein n=1 Tax=Elysia crispata TaxID=231223 RepID=A0AAE1B7H1_9GAST|nr:hypothetical protein RRG08_008622 [Elysia crispata]